MTRPLLRHLRATDFRVRPWKNGGGTTTELVIEPEGASLESGFLLRLSRAEVGVSGPFSAFEGYDRTLLLLRGGGMWLHFEGQGPVQLQRLLQPVSFSGDWATTGTLIEGPCQDFNVITRRGLCTHHLEILHLDASPKALLEAQICFACCVEGRVALEPGGVQLCAGELLRIEAADRVPTASALEGARAVLIAVGIDPVA
jgi:hypothetical protein